LVVSVIQVKALKNRIDLATTTRIAVDETATKRGHNYVTIFTDMDSEKLSY